MALDEALVLEVEGTGRRADHGTLALSTLSHAPRQGFLVCPDALCRRSSWYRKNPDEPLRVDGGRRGDCVDDTEPT